MADIVDLPQQAPPHFIVGPFTEHRVKIEGRIIPHMTAVDRGDTVDIVVDHRFSATFPKEFAYQTAWLVANALAIGSGYACLSSETKDQPFAPMGMEMDGLPDR